mgnify:CR=1 FL=1
MDLGAIRRARRMKLEPDRCFDCGDCVSVCPVDAIRLQAGVISVDQARCVECGVCWRTGICPTSVFEPEELPWPRLVRALFSDPATEHRRTRLAGRGTEEIKTNDVRHCYVGDWVGVAAEVGRPGVGASFHDVQCVTQAFAEGGARFVADNPLMELIADPARGRLDPTLLDERVLSVIVEGLVPVVALEPTLRALVEACSRLSAPVLLSVVGGHDIDGSMSYRPVLEKMAFTCLPTGKMNLGFMA